jgi:hypothetical protein
MRPGFLVMLVLALAAVLSLAGVAQAAAPCPTARSVAKSASHAKKVAKREGRTSRRARRARATARARAAQRRRCLAARRRAEATKAQAAAATPVRPFAPSSFWNAPLPDDAPLDVNSAMYVAELRRQVAAHGPYVNTTRYSVPVYTVPSWQKKVRVKLDNNHPELSEAFARVPLPDNARPAAGTDANLVVWQPSTDTLWEFWRLDKWLLDGWHADFGGRMHGVSANPGHYTDPPGWGATATSIPLLGGLIRLHELEAGRIDHGLAFAMPEHKRGVFSWPAQRTDGKSWRLTAVPAGTRFRIDPRLDLDTIPMAPIVRLMADAVQRYGMVLRDGAGAVTFYAEDPTPTGRNPYLGPNGHFGGEYIGQLLEQFPWAHLQALRTQVSYER